MARRCFFAAGYGKGIEVGLKRGVGEGGRVRQETGEEDPLRRVTLFTTTVLGWSWRVNTWLGHSRINILTVVKNDPQT